MQDDESAPFGCHNPKGCGYPQTTGEDKIVKIEDEMES
jgi:hypothetical protein